MTGTNILFYYSYYQGELENFKNFHGKEEIRKFLVVEIIVKI